MPVRYSRLILFTLCLLALIGLTTRSQIARAATDARAQLTIHPTQIVAPVTPLNYGSNIPLWLGDSLQDPTLIARTRASGIRALRIPGGSTSDEYGWLSCEKRQNQPNAYHCVADGWEQWAARPTDFINFIRATGITNVIYTMNVNVTPQEAAAAVAFFNAAPSNNTVIGTDVNGFDWQTAGHWAQLRIDDGNTAPLGIKYWEIGNEVYGADPAVAGNNCISYGWENAWTCDGGQYANGDNTHAGFSAMRTAMRAIDSTIKVGAVGEGLDSATYFNWDDKVLDAAGSSMDFIVTHPYAYDTPPPNTAAGWAEILAKPRSLWSSLKQHFNAEFLAHANNRAVPIIATEFNIPAVQEDDNQQMMNRAGNALFMAESIGQGIENGFIGTNQWDLSNGCATNGACYDLLQFDHAFQRSAPYYAYPLWSRFGSTMVGITNSRDAVMQLSAYAGKIDAHTYSVLVINKTSHVYKSTVALDTNATITSVLADTVIAKSLGVKKVKFNGNANPADDLSDAPSKSVPAGSPTLNYSFAPYSITLLRLTVP